MSATTSIIKKVSDQLGIASKFIDKSKIVLQLNFGKKTHTFISNISGLNDEAVQKICRDKFYTYLLLKDDLSLAKSNVFIDPDADDIYEGFSEQKSNPKIVDEILKNHSFPVIVKANSLARGLNVYKCHSAQEVATVVENIFNKDSKNYDHVLISEDFIDIKEEYRVVVYDQQIMFAYLKDNSGAKTGAKLGTKFVGNLSPLHWEGSKAVLIEDQELLEDLNKFSKPIYSKLSLKYGGLDIAKDKDGKLWLIEINTQPGFSFFIRDNSDVEVVKMYTQILEDLSKK